jgi:hypothetical protein
LLASNLDPIGLILVDGSGSRRSLRLPGTPPCLPIFSVRAASSGAIALLFCQPRDSSEVDALLVDAAGNLSVPMAMPSMPVDAVWSGSAFTVAWARDAYFNLSGDYSQVGPDGAVLTTARIPSMSDAALEEIALAADGERVVLFGLHEHGQGIGSYPTIDWMSFMDGSQATPWTTVVTGEREYSTPVSLW